MMVEGIAARPVDEPDVRIGESPSVEVERRARLQQHVRDARERDEGVDAVRSQRQRGWTHPQRRPADVAERAVALAEAAAR